MAGQVKHKQIFSSIRPDWRLAKLLLNLRTRSTDALLGAVAKVLGDEGIELISSTTFLEPLLAEEGVLTERAPRRRRAQEHRVRPWRGASARRLRHRPDRRRRRAGLRRRRGHGGHRRHHRARRPADGILEGGAASTLDNAAPHRRQSRQAQSGHALRRACHRHRHHRNHDPRRSHLPLHRGRPHAALRPRSPPKRANDAGIDIVAAPR